MHVNILCIVLICNHHGTFDHRQLLPGVTGNQRNYRSCYDHANDILWVALHLTPFGCNWKLSTVLYWKIFITLPKKLTPETTSFLWLVRPSKNCKLLVCLCRQYFRSVERKPVPVRWLSVHFLLLQRQEQQYLKRQTDII